MRTPISTPQAGVAAPVRARRQQDLLILPEARPPRRWGLIGAIVAGVMAALVVGGTVGYVIADDRADVRVDAAAAARLDAEAAALVRIDAAQQRVVFLEQREAQLQDTVEGQRRANQVVLATRREVRVQLEDARAELGGARADLRALQGPAVTDGTHIGRVVAVGSSQSPARVVVVVGRWFTGPDARRAAIEDGVIVKGQRLPHRRYFRPGEAWSTLDASSTVTVTVRRWTGNLGSRTVSLIEFERILRLDAPWARRAAHDVFWITVAGGDVISMQQQRYP